MKRPAERIPDRTSAIPMAAGSNGLSCRKNGRTVTIPGPETYDERNVYSFLEDRLEVGLEGVNITGEEIYQHCVAKTGPLCFAGYPDRRYVVGATYRF